MLIFDSLVIKLQKKMKKKEKKRKKQTLVIFCVVSFGRMYQPNQRNLSLKKLLVIEKRYSRVS